MTKHRLFSAFFLLAVASAPRAEVLRPNDTVAICGDSITEQKLYSVFMENYLLMCQPVPGIRAHQIGWSGEAADGFRNRVKSDVLPFAPTVATTFYGMNDGRYQASDPANVARFKKHTIEFIELLKQGGVRTILVGSPGSVDGEKFKTWRLAKVSPDAYNRTLSDLGATAREASQEQGVLFVDVHASMREAEKRAKAKYGADYPFARDGVHPQSNGQLVIAYAFLRGLGMDGDIGTITLNAASGRATATAGHKILSATDRRIEIESSRYPFCFVDDPKDPESTHAILDCVPFNEDLNRFRLVVTGVRAPRIKITWGSTSKTFSADALARGINLAAEFLDNPFVEPFKRVQAAVKTQQEFETPGVKTILHSLPGWRKLLPEEAATFGQLARGVVAKANRLEAAARAEVVPVTHIVLVEPAP